MSKHTEGPWSVIPPTSASPSEAMVGAKEGWVGIYRAPLTNETEANARLIAAAPELLEALEAVFNTYNCSQADGHTHGSKPKTCAMCRARAAIAKARGE